MRHNSHEIYLNDLRTASESSISLLFVWLFDGDCVSTAGSSTPFLSICPSLRCSGCPWSPHVFRWHEQKKKRRKIRTLMMFLAVSVVIVAVVAAVCPCNDVRPGWPDDMQMPSDDSVHPYCHNSPIKMGDMVLEDVFGQHSCPFTVDAFRARNLYGDNDAPMCPGIEWTECGKSTERTKQWPLISFYSFLISHHAHRHDYLV